MIREKALVHHANVDAPVYPTDTVPIGTVSFLQFEFYMEQIGTPDMVQIGTPYFFLILIHTMQIGASSFNINLFNIY